nr:hypothetical protein [Tanacetum cinerariifolium]
MHTSTDDYLINTLRFVSIKEETQIYGAILLESLTSPEIKETQAYKTYLGFATGATPPKKERKFKKPTSPKLTIVLVSTEELTGKSKRVKRHAKKSTEASARGVIIRETPEMPLSKKKEKVDVTRGKGIELLSQVALTEDAQFEEVQRKSMRDFHKTHPIRSGTVTKTALSVAKIKPSVTSEGTGVKPGVLNVAEEESSKKEEDEFVRTPSNDSDEDETKITDKAKGDKDEEIDYITSQLYNNVDIRLNKPIDTDKSILTVIPQSLPSFTPPPQKSTSTPPPTTEAINPQSALPNFTSIFQFNNKVIGFEKEVAELKNDPLHTQAAVTLTEFELKKILIDKMDKVKSYLAAPEHIECYKGLKKLYDLDKTIFSTYGKVYSLKRSRKDKDEDPCAGSDRGLKKKKTSKDAEPAKGQAFRLLKGTRSNYAKLEYDFKECNKALSGKLDWENPEGCDYPFDLTKPLPLVMNGNRQMVPVDYFFNNDLKYLQGGISTMTYMNSLTKTKAAQYNLLGNKDMVPNIWVPVKVAYDKHALWVEVMRKHGYGYLKENVVRRADNDLYRFKEGDW